MFPSKTVARRSGLARAVNLALRYRPVAELKPSPKNPRVHTPRQIDQIARSIAQFGFNCPILVDPDDHVIAGHGRLEAAKQLGLDCVPTICLDHLTANEAKAFFFLDTRLDELASWDDAVLGETFD
jgi:ParB-like chromosome segregation protein Spo0J